MSGKSTETKDKEKNILYLSLVMVLLLAFRILPILKAPISNYGYDFGFYDYAIKHLTFPSIRTLLPSLWGGYNNPLFYLTKIFHLPPDIVLNELYFLSAVFLGLACYLFFPKQNKIAGILAVALCALSLIQTEAYTMFLWKNLLALPFLVLGFKFLSQKKYWPFILCSLVIILTHRTTAIVYFLTIIFYLFWEKIKSKEWTKLGFGIIILSVIFGLSWPIIKPISQSLLLNSNTYVRDGLFLENQNIFKLIWPVLALALAGFILYIKNHGNVILNIFTVLVLSWFLLHLPFYRRMLIYLDVSIILYAAYFLGQVNYSRKIIKLALIVLLIFLSFQAVEYTLSKQPLISVTEVNEIKNFIKPPGFILAVSAADAPWMLAYALNQRLGAPGLLEDTHSYQEWQAFWQGQNQRQFLTAYPRPLYFYQRSWRLQNYGVSTCLKPLTANFFQLDYSCLEKNLQ